MKFKTTLSIPQTYIGRQSASPNLEELAAAAAENRRRRHTSSDYTTDVSLFNSKSDSWALSPIDEMIQTSGLSGDSLLFNDACTDAERYQQLQQQQQQQQNSLEQEDETTEFLLPSKVRLSSNHPPHSPLKPASSNLVTSTENPWKKLSNVRYKLDGPNGDQRNQTNFEQIHEQHITFV